VPTTIDVEILEGSDTMVPDSAQLHYRYDGGEFVTTPLTLVDELYQGTLPPAQCEDTPEFYFSVEGSVTGVVYQPPGAPAAPFIAFVGLSIVTLEDDFETDQGWTVVNDPSLTGGAWERDIPFGSEPEPDRSPPPTDYDGSGNCYLTANQEGDSDVDGGPTFLISPTLDLSGTGDPMLRYARWWANDDQDGDPLDVEISNDDGGSWTLIERVTNIPPGWVERTVYISDFITPTSLMKIRFSAMDNPNNSKDEGGVDAVRVFDIQCE
jgi:hypothetical protein